MSKFKIGDTVRYFDGKLGGIDKITDIYKNKYTINGRSFNEDDLEVLEDYYNQCVGGMPENAYSQNDYVDNFVEIFLSLSLALQNAGGSVKTLEELKRMSAYDLICTLAPNKIRFTKI